MSEQWIIRRLSFEQVAEMIERHVRFVDGKGREIRPPAAVVRHYMQRTGPDRVLPTIAAITTLPIVFADGGVRAEDGLDRDSGVEYHIAPEIAACVPKTVSDDDVRAKMAFLLDEWLCDVATSFAGKCTAIAFALTLIERTLLDCRPVFFVVAGHRGGGKTTTLTMLIKAVIGAAPAAAAWSPNEEERRKAVFAYFMQGMPYILWDNIPRGLQIFCPHIERSCTAEAYIDRELGVSKTVAVSASTIHCFTGNNIGPRGDLGSRSLMVRLETDRHDPENRAFRHPDPIGWTDAHRPEILGALYTILLGNPALQLPRNAPMKTRFKIWWRIVGSAVEHAARLVADRVEPGAFDDDERSRPCPIDFRELFLESEADDDDSGSLADALNALLEYLVTITGKTFSAAEVAKLCNDTASEHGRILRDFLYPGAAEHTTVTARSAGMRLKNHVGHPVRHGEYTLILRREENSHIKVGRFYIQKKDDCGD